MVAFVKAWSGAWQTFCRSGEVNNVIAVTTCTLINTCRGRTLKSQTLTTQRQRKKKNKKRRICLVHIVVAPRTNVKAAGESQNEDAAAGRPTRLPRWPTQQKQTKFLSPPVRLLFQLLFIFPPFSFFCYHSFFNYSSYYFFKKYQIFYNDLFY
jgi:hypothetical protein